MFVTSPSGHSNAHSSLRTSEFMSHWVLQTESHSKFQGWSLEEVAKAIPNVLWARKQQLLRKHVYSMNSGTQIPFTKQWAQKAFFTVGSLTMNGLANSQKLSGLQMFILNTFTKGFCYLLLLLLFHFQRSGINFPKVMGPILASWGKNSTVPTLVNSPNNPSLTLPTKFLIAKVLTVVLYG